MSHIDVRLGEYALGTVHRHPDKTGERIAFRYANEWLNGAERFAIDPELFLDARTTSPARGGLFGAFADCAPDRWGRQLMQRRERHRAAQETREVRTLSELDYLLCVSDQARPGALRFLVNGEYAAKEPAIPPLVRLGDLLNASRNVEREVESDEDMALLFAPGSSLGGARPKLPFSIGREDSRSQSFRAKATSTVWNAGNGSRCSWHTQRAFASRKPSSPVCAVRIFSYRAASTVRVKNGCILRPR
jgi:hypothetical protein